MVLELHGAAISTCTKTAAVVLHEKGVPFKFIPVDVLAAEHKSAAYLEKQPFGQIPYLNDDGFILYESRAIARYIEEKYPNQGTKLIPTDLKAKALFEQAASIEQNNFYPHAIGALWEKVFKKWRGLEADEEVYKEKIDALAARLDVYDKILAKQKYLAGDEITLADLFHLSSGVLLPDAGSNVINERPNVARWFKDISSRASWQAVKDGVNSTA